MYFEFGRLSRWQLYKNHSKSLKKTFKTHKIYPDGKKALRIQRTRDSTWTYYLLHTMNKQKRDAIIRAKHNDFKSD